MPVISAILAPLPIPLPCVIYVLRACEAMQALTRGGPRPPGRPSRKMGSDLCRVSILRDARNRNRLCRFRWPPLEGGDGPSVNTTRPRCAAAGAVEHLKCGLILRFLGVMTTPVLLVPWRSGARDRGKSGERIQCPILGDLGLIILMV